MKNPPLRISLAKVGRVGIHHKKGFNLVRTDEIIRCEAAGNYSFIFLSDGTNIMICRKLKELEASLLPFDFIRVHHQHLVNLNYVKAYNRGKKRLLTLSNKEGIEVSLTRQKTLLERIYFL